MNEEEADLLPGLDAARERSLLSALDRIRGKHGERAVMSGGAMVAMLSMPGASPGTFTTSTFTR